MLNCHSQPAIDIAIAIFALCVMICSIWSVLTFFQSFKKHESETNSSSKIKINPLILYTCVVAAMLGILCLVGVLGISTACLFDLSKLYDITAGIHLWSYGMLCILVVAICDIRLYTVFNTTIYAYSNIVFILLAVAFFIIVLGCFLIPVFWILENSATSLLLTIVGVVFLVQSITTLVLFIRGLFKVESCKKILENIQL